MRGSIRGVDAVSAIDTVTKPPFAPIAVELRDGRRALIRSAVPDDAAAIIRYMNTALPGFTEFVLTGPDEFDMDEQDERAWIERQASKPGSLALLAVAGDAVVAMMNCSARTGRRRIAHVGEIGMSIARPWWGVGLGTRMMAALIDWAEAHPLLGLLELGVYADNERALRLYRGCGFVQAGTIPRRTRFDDGSTRDDITMYRRVDGTLSGTPDPEGFRADLGGGAVMRQVSYGDAEKLWPIYDRNRERLRPWFRWAPSVRSVGDVRGGIAEWIERQAGEGTLTCVIEEAGEVRGLAYLVMHNRTDRKTELGYWLDAGHEGRGLVTRACRSLVRYAFEQLGVNRIDITADVDNTRSQAVADRLGFERESVIRQWMCFEGGRFADMVNFRLLREDWEPEPG